MASNSRPRVLLFPVDDSDDSERSFDWMIKNLFKPDDEVNGEVPASAWSCR